MVAQPPLPVLLTRPQAQSEQFAASLPTSLRPVISPLLRIVHLAGFTEAPPDAMLIFTSANGVDAYTAKFPANGQAALCVGQRTTDIATRAGFAARSADGDAASVIAAARGLSGPFFHVRGVHARGEIATQLTAIGKHVDEAIAYDQAPASLSTEARAALNRPCLVPLFSPRTAALFVQDCPTAPEALLIAMSPAVARRLPQNAFKAIKVLKTPEAAAMRDALLAYAGGIDLEADKPCG